MLSSSLFSQVASYYGWPVSTTHCIVGSMVGFGLVYGGAGAVFWSSLAKVASSWVISPLMGALVSFLVYKCIRRVSKHKTKQINLRDQTISIYIYICVKSIVLFNLYIYIYIVTTIPNEH